MHHVGRGSTWAPAARRGRGGTAAHRSRSSRRILAVGLGALLTWIGPAAFAAGPGPDITFGTGHPGVVISALGDGRDARAHAVVTQPDGKVLVGGSAKDGDQLLFALARYSGSGELDTTFGTGGVVLTRIGDGRAAGINTLLIQSDGEIVAVGTASDDGQQKFALDRYTSSGILDTSFGTAGVVLTPIGGANSTADSLANAAVLQPDGKIVAVGTTSLTVQVGPSESVQSVFALARYTTSGALDTGFGTNGLTASTIGNGNYAVANAALLQTDGGLLVAGSAFQGTGTDFAVARYTPAGVLDTGFGTSGVTLTPIGSVGGVATAYGLAAAAGGAIVADGYAQDHGKYKFAAARYTSAGALDTSFGTGGSVLTAVGADGSAAANALLAEPGGVLLGVGTALDGGKHKIALTRWTATGDADITFGTGGTLLIDIGEGAAANAAAIQSDGKILTAGFAFAAANVGFDFLTTRSQISG
jgi:uncharacterized delta-60 repeat protein